MLTRDDIRTVRDLADRSFPGRLVGGKVKAPDAAAIEAEVRADLSSGRLDPDATGRTLPRLRPWMDARGKPADAIYRREYQGRVLLLTIAPDWRARLEATPDARD